MRRKGVDEAWQALEDMQRQGLFVDRFTVSRMLMKTVSEGRARWNPHKVYRGIALVERFMQLQPEEADEVLFNALLDTCCRMKDLSRLEVTMQRMRDLQIYPSHVTLGILVKAYGQAGDISNVLKVWEEMDEQRRQANAVTYGCMIDACVKCGHVQKAVDIFQDMKKKKKHRNTILYTTLIKGYGMEKDVKNALELFREMRTEGVPYNTITYNSIIDVCIKCSEVETAEDLLREMMSPGTNLEPDLITYSTVLKGYCHAGDLDKALQVAETIKACGLKCDELVYNTLMDGCVKANDLSAGIGLFAEMTASGMQPSSITHSILVRLYQRNGYKGDAYDAVAQLYQHHGLERPVGVLERGAGSKGSGGRKAGGRQQQQAQRGMPPPRGGVGPPGQVPVGYPPPGPPFGIPAGPPAPLRPPGVILPPDLPPYGDHDFDDHSGCFGGCGPPPPPLSTGGQPPLLGTSGVPCATTPYPCGSSVPYTYAGMGPYGPAGARGGPPMMQGPVAEMQPYPGMGPDLLQGLYGREGPPPTYGGRRMGPLDGQAFGGPPPWAGPPGGMQGPPLPPAPGSGSRRRGRSDTALVPPPMPYGGLPPDGLPPQSRWQ